jgi:glycosyltransferase involved in cell wall biosynthesis
VTSNPAVSICVPAFNAARWIRPALDSALAQTLSDFELLVADNASTDETAEIARSYGDPRIRVATAPRTIGAVANHNRAVTLSRGRFVKFLHADDLLLPRCLERMVSLALEDDRVGLVFAPRDVLVEDAPDPEWVEHFRRPHEGFGPLASINDGRDLLHRLLRRGFEENWVGEPSAVLVRRSALERVGMLNERLVQVADLELWARIMVGHRVGFVDAVLSVYRHHGGSGTVANARFARDWFDRPWLLEGLLAAEGLTGEARSRLLELRRAAVRRALRAQLGRLARGNTSTELLAYVAYRVRGAVGRAPRLSPPLEDVPGRATAGAT